MMTPPADHGETRSQRLVDPAVLQWAVAHNGDALDVVSFIAGEISARPVRVSVFRPDGSVVDVENHPALEFLQKHIHGYTRTAYIERAVTHLLAANGEHYAEIRGRPTALSPGLGLLVVPDVNEVFPILTADRLALRSFEVQLQTGTYHVAPDRMIRCALSPMLPGSMKFAGVSPLYPLLSDMRGDRHDQHYMATSARGLPRNLSVKVVDNADMGVAMTRLEMMDEARRLIGYHLAPAGMELAGLPVDKESESILERRKALSEAIVRHANVAPVLWNFSVTNDSAAKAQAAHQAQYLRRLTRQLWAGHEVLVQMLSTPDQIAKGVHLRTDWSVDALGGVDAETDEDADGTEDQARDAGGGLRVVAGGAV